MIRSSFLPAPALGVAVTPWIRAAVLVGALHGAGISAALLLQSRPVTEDMSGADAVLEIATLVTTADSTESAEQAAQDGAQEAQTPEVEERLSKQAEDQPTEQASPRPPAEDDLRMAQQKTQQQTDKASFKQTSEASQAQPQAMAQEASVASEESLAAPDEKEAETAAPENGNAKEADRKIAAWQRMLFSHVAKFKSYPQAARRSHLTGESLIGFSLARDGTVSHIQVVRSSGSALLDDTAMNVLRRANPLPPLPPEMRRERIELTLPMKFSLR